MVIKFNLIKNLVSQGNNSVFSFGFADSVASVPFALDSNTGVITVNGSLDYEIMQQYSFMVGTDQQLYVDKVVLRRSHNCNLVYENGPVEIRLLLTA